VQQLIVLYRKRNENVIYIGEKRKIPMINNLEKQKEVLKAKLSQAVDEYYESFSQSSNMPKFTINEIEQLMLEQQRTFRETLEESNSELISQIETVGKKNALSAAIICAEPKKTKK
jgi:hypothetical protein